jgi:hypothetical protein
MLYFCDIRENVNEAEMLAWLAYVGAKPPEKQIWETPHPLAGSSPLASCLCVWFRDLDIAAEFAELYGVGVYSQFSPYRVA